MLKMNKQVVLLGTAKGKSAEEFQKYYIGEFAKSVAANSKVKQYYANKIVEPSKELAEAGWGWGGNDDSGIYAMDELWVEEGFDVLSLYTNNDEVKVIYAYDTEEVIIKPTLGNWGIGNKSPWVKRIGLIKCQDGQRPIDFFQYWMKTHSHLAMRTHIGAGFYSQMHFQKPLVDDNKGWNGMMILDYWSVDAFHFGHFSRPTASAEIKEDCSCFLNVFNTLCGEEYVMKRMDGYVDMMFDGYRGYIE